MVGQPGSAVFLLGGAVAAGEYDLRDVLSLRPAFLGFVPAEGRMTLEVPPFATVLAPGTSIGLVNPRAGGGVVGAPAVVVGLVTPRPPERLLRSASGYPDPQWTQGAILLPVWSHSSQTTYSLTGIPFTTGAASLSIRSLRAVVNDDFDGDMTDTDWANQTWTVNVFVADAQHPTALAAYDADPRTGNYIANRPLLESHVPFGMDYWTTLVSSSPLMLEANETYFISIKATRINPTPTTKPSARHSTFAPLLPSDWVDSQNFVAQPYTSYGFFPGVAAIDLYGY